MNSWTLYQWMDVAPCTSSFNNLLHLMYEVFLIWVRSHWVVGWLKTLTLHLKLDHVLFLKFQLWHLWHIHFADLPIVNLRGASKKFPAVAEASHKWFRRRKQCVAEFAPGCWDLRPWLLRIPLEICYFKGVQNCAKLITHIEKKPLGKIRCVFWNMLMW